MVGRDREAARLEALIRTATRGGSGALLVTGEPGIGKTLLLDHARQYAEGAGCLVLGATSVEAESRLPFAGLADMLGPILSLIDRVPRSQAAALRGALAMGPPAPGDRFSAYAGAFSLLAAAAEERPLVCVVDDAHWLDAESLEALLFAARRIEAEGVVILLASRDSGNEAAEDDRIDRMHLTGLSPDAAEQLLRDRAPSNPDPAIASGLVSAASGNPLALTELATVLTSEQLAGTDPLPDPLPVGQGLAHALLRPVAKLPARTRRALLIASAGDPMTAAVDAALEAAGLNRDDLRPAHDAGIVAVGEAIAFAHPLLRGAVYGQAPAPDRRQAHRAHARATADGAGADPDRHAWHLALASTGPDEQAAAALEGAGGRAMARTAFAAASEALETAAHLSSEPVGRGRRQIAAARAAFAMGAFTRAGELFDRAIALDAAPDQVFDAMAGRGASEMLGGSARRATEMLVAAANKARGFAPPAAAALLTLATVPAIMRTDLAAAQAAAADAEVLGRGGPPVLAAQLAVARASIATLGGAETVADHEALAVLAEAGAGGDPTAGLWIIIHHQTLVWCERYQEARAGLNALIGGLREQGAPSALAWPLQARAELCLRIGEVDRAASDAAEGVRLAEDTRQTSMAGTGRAILATIEAMTGHDEDAQDHAVETLAAADRSEALSLRFYALGAQGLLALGRRRLDEAIAAYSQLDAEFRRRVDAHPLITPWEQDQVETLIRLGRVDDAARELKALERQATRTGSAWTAAAAARCRGMLAADADFEDDFARAMEAHARTSIPFEQARTELCLGERRRRARRPGDAREPLASALATFEALGTEPWAALAREELAAAGAPVPPRRGPPRGDLTTQELRVALCVADGRTNREVAAALFISPRTVDSHLGRVYAKLGVRTRAELAARLAEEMPD